MISATVTIRTATTCYVYDAVGISTWRIEESARELAGDEPCSVSVLVLQ